MHFDNVKKNCTFLKLKCFYLGATDLGCVVILTSIIIIEWIKRAFQYYQKHKASKLGPILPRFSDDAKQSQKKDLLKDYKAKQSTLNKKETKMDMSQVNTYDLFKLVSTVAMFIDHYGYFGLPGITPTQRNWCRIIGRFAAPGFFFLAGYASKRFRPRTWATAFFLYYFTTVAPLGIVYSPWESILNIAIINCIFEYLPPHKLKIMEYKLFNIVLFGLLWSIRDYCSQKLLIGYGTLPFMLAIAGDLHRHKHSLAKAWIIGSMFVFFYSSNAVFASNMRQTVGIAMACLSNAVFMMSFKLMQVSQMAKSRLLNWTTDGIKWISREGLVVYVGHLMLYRLISALQYTWSSPYFSS